MRVASALVLLFALSLPSATRADDWLAALPSCGFATRASLPSFELLYPRPGLPAVVEAGQTLVARVRLPSPLTPPPGIQQPRALTDWRAELTGHALSLAPNAHLEHRYPLEVVDVRPNDGSSLVYRASLPIPAWTAPGSYDLALWAPGGNGQGRSVLRVLARGRAPRLAWTAAGDPPQASAAIAALPVDVWVSAASSTPEPATVATAAARGPSLELHDLVAALRVGSALWVLGACESQELLEQVAGVLARERRTRFLPVPEVGNGQWQAFGAQPQRWPGPDSLRLEHDADQLHVEVQGSFGGDAELSFLLPAGARRFEATGAARRFYPAGEVAGAVAPALVVSMRVPAGGSAQLRRGVDAALDATLFAQPSLARSGERVLLQVKGDDTAMEVAWRLDRLHTVFGPRAIEHQFGPLGVHRFDALVIAGDGRALHRVGRVQVQTSLASSCRCMLGSRQSAGRFWLALPVLSAVSFRLRRRAAKKAPARTQPE